MIAIISIGFASLAAAWAVFRLCRAVDGAIS